LRKTIAMNLKHIGVECKLVEASQFLQIYINGKVQAPLVYCSLLKTARDITQQFADVGSGEFYAVFGKRVWQDSERLLFDRAFAGVRVGGFILIDLFIFLCRGGKKAPMRGAESQGTFWLLREVLQT
jgi:hypothetical protein